MVSSPQSDRWIAQLSHSVKDHAERRRRFIDLMGERQLLRFHEYDNVNNQYWAALTYADVMEVGSDNQRFSSSGRTMLVGDVDYERVISRLAFTGSIMTMDNPEHSRVRSIVTSAFTPKSVKSLTGSIEESVDDAVKYIFDSHPDGIADFRREFADRVTAGVICRMMGIDLKSIQWVIDQTASMMIENHPAIEGGNRIAWIKSMKAVKQFAMELAADKQRDPTDDLTSRLMSASVNQETLTIEEYADFFSLLLNAGVETTANIIAAATFFLHAHPEQRHFLEESFDARIDVAVEEFCRFHTPIIHFTRTATCETEVNGVEVATGDRVAMFYGAANYDPETFVDPLDFNIQRPTKPIQLSFGTPNNHFCLGANLARAEIASAINALLHHFPNYKPLSEHMTFIPSRWAHGWSKLPVKFV